MRRFLPRIWKWLKSWFRKPDTSYSLFYIDGDELPATLPERTLVVAREDELLWSAGMTCPCGCGRRIEVMLLPDIKPRWDLLVSPDGRPSLTPSVWVNTGCRAHFWLKDGRVRWCD